MKISLLISPLIFSGLLLSVNHDLKAQNDDKDTNAKNTVVIKTITIQDGDTTVREKRISRTKNYIINEQRDNHNNYSKIIQGNFGDDEDEDFDNDVFMWQDSLGRKMVIIEKNLDSLKEASMNRSPRRDRMMKEHPSMKDRFFEGDRGVFYDEYHPEQEAEVINNIRVYSNDKDVVFRFDFQPINKKTSLIIKDDKGNELHKEIIKSSTNPVVREITLGLNNSGIYFVTIKKGNKAINQKIRIL